MTSDNDIVCTAMDIDWGDNTPNLLMHPPCACLRCSPADSLELDREQWLTIAGQAQRVRVEPAELGIVGRATLG